LDNPLLIDKRKWDLRVFVLLIATGDKWIYFFSKGYARMSQNVYNFNEFSLKTHTTHTRVDYS